MGFKGQRLQSCCLYSQMLSASKNPRTTRHVSSRRPAAEGCGSALLRPLPKTAARWPLCGVQAHPSALPSLYLTLGAARWPCRAALPREASRSWSLRPPRCSPKVTARLLLMPNSLMHFCQKLKKGLMRLTPEYPSAWFAVGPLLLQTRFTLTAFKATPKSARSTQAQWPA